MSFPPILKTTRRLIAVLTTTLWVIGSLTAAVNAQQSEDPLPPLLLETIPADGQEWDGGPVTFIFDQPMDAEMARALTVRPPVSGNVEVDGNRVFFDPVLPEEILVGERYRISFNTLAESADGVALSAPVGISLMGEAPLQIIATRPDADEGRVGQDTPITVIFNQPMVPLLGVDDQADLPNPLSIDPPVEGEGEWTSTSIFTFQPTEPLVGGQPYVAEVGSIASVTGKELAESYRFTFTVGGPTVSTGDLRGNRVSPNTVVELDFSQPMQTETVEAAFAFVKTVPNPYSSPKITGTTVITEPEPVAGRFGWSNDDQTAIFTPTVPLALGQSYEYNILEPQNVLSKQGAPLENSGQWTFSVVPLPSIRGANPISGSVEVAPDQDVEIRFHTPMSRTSVLSNIHVTPLLTATTVFSRYNEYDSTLVLSWAKEPQTTYTISIDGSTVDELGNPLGAAYQSTFTTGDHRPFIRSTLQEFTHFSAYTTTRVGITHRNVDSIDTALYRLPVEDFLALAHEPYRLSDGYQLDNPDLYRIWSRSIEPLADWNETAQRVIPLLDDDGKSLQPGLYLFEVELPPATVNGTELPRGRNEYRVIVISNHQLTVKRSVDGQSLAWLTDLTTGEPVSDRNVQFWSRSQLRGAQRTDASGIAATDLALNQDNFWEPMLAITGTPGDDDFAVASTRWNQGINTWEFGINGSYYNQPYQIHGYTERPIYRPGQTIYWKAIIRERVGEAWSLPQPDVPVGVRIYSPQGETILNETMSVNEFGTIHGKVELAEVATTGFYNIEVQVGGEALDNRQGLANANIQFQVAAYRKPEFEITVTTDQPDYQDGETIQATVEARYFSGGPLAGAELTWRLLSQDFRFDWEDRPARRYYSFQPYNPEQDSYDPYRSRSSGGLLKEGTGKLGPDGTFAIELPADLTNSPTSQNWTVDFTVQSSTNQFVSGSAEATVHKSDVYIGISPQRYVVRDDEESAVDLVTLTPEQEIYPNAELEVIVQKFNWNSVYERGPNGYFYWRSRVERSPILTKTVTTNELGQATFTWQPTDGGSYQVVARSMDQPASSAGFVYVSSYRGFVSWQRENHDRIELVADKDVYDVGDVAEILVPSPFMGQVNALVTIERGGVLSSTVVTLQGNSEVLEIPITEEHIPNIFVSVLLIKGVDETNPIPAMRLGYVQLQVDTSQKVLDIEIESSVPEVRPGDTVSYTLEVRDATGALVPNAEVSVALVDKAIFTLSDREEPSLVDIFYAIRGLGVETGALLNINLDRISQQLTEGTKGGGGGDGSGLEIRGDFRDVAYWQADLVTDADGRATISVDLPDNLTTWRMVARAVTNDTLVGEAEHDLLSTKRLQMRTLLPRFVTAGDKVQIGAALLNSGLADLTGGEISLDLFGARIIDGDERLTNLTFNAESESRFDWTIEVEKEALSVDFIFSAVGSNENGQLSDGVEIGIPVKRFATRETVATAGTVDGLSRVEAIRAPSNASAETNLVVQLEPSLAAGMLDSLDYLTHYEHECNEQLTSRFLPNLFTVQALKKLNVPNEALEQTLDSQVNLAVQKLSNRQNPDGGWGYWPTEQSYNFVSAYILWGLWHADQLGYTVPRQMLDMGASYLERNYLAPSEAVNDWQLNELAFVHMVLADMGRGDPGRASTLYDERHRLHLYGQAYLAQALAAMATPDGEQYEPGSDEQVESLLDALFSEAELTATGAFWTESTIDYRNLNTDIRTTAIILATFSRLAPDDPMLPSVVRWLMDARKAGRWPSTQENAWSLIALTEWMQASQELEADYEWRVAFGDTEIGAGTFDDANIQESVRVETTVKEASALAADVSATLEAEAQRLLIERDNTSGQLYYTTYMRYYLDALDVNARDRGLAIMRRFSIVDPTGKAQPVDTAQVGDIISVTATLIAPTTRHQVLVEIPIPAGTEPIDPNLATESEAFDGPSVTRNNGPLPYWYWWQWRPTHVDIRDDRVAFYVTYLREGTYEYSFQVRATVPGEYRVLPAITEQMYFTEVWGRSSGELFVVED